MKRLLLSCLALLLLFEEWLWDILTRAGHKLATLLHLQRLEIKLQQAPPRFAALAFVIPLLIVTPLNLVAFWMIARGQILRGIALEIFAKLLGTALIARVFALTRPQLMSLRWFSITYLTISGWLLWAHQRVQETAVYQTGKRLKASLRAFIAQWNKNT